ncbi:MAG: oxidoreductase [Betaproteobacteria bacterium]|nr:oxidoreductase [Betaproteobacteria bacterium]
MKKWNLVIDVATCFSCNACAVACHDEYHGNEFPGYAAEMPKHGQRWIDIRQREKGKFPMVEVSYLPVTCNHCDDAPCMKAAKDGAITKRPDGIVIIDPVKAKGQKQLVDACPYGAIHWNEEKQLPQAWPFDAHLLDQGWTKTRGSQVCPTQAMRTLHVEDDEMQRIVKEEGLQVLHPEFKTKPRIYYKNLDRFYKAFVGGSVAGMIDGVIECIEGARVVLRKGEQPVAESKTDTYGDFKFQGLDENSGGYRIEIIDERFAAKTIQFDLKESAYLGTIAVEKVPAKGFEPATP